tara:strand:- start:164 stop:394 length:231 start_codon:yes stop_codon:yes gene_type:complete
MPYAERSEQLRRIVAWILICSGITATVSGIIFILQSAGILGPESSFMVRNSDWTGYGIMIISVGLVLIIVGKRIRQ